MKPAEKAGSRPKRRVLTLAMALALLTAACTGPAPSPSPSPVTGTGGGPIPGARVNGQYPWHTGIVATTFWVGEIFDPNAADGSQVISTYDSKWMVNYGGCDGIKTNGCATEPRTSGNGYAPTSMTPKQNPFYLDLPYDDIHNAAAFAERGKVIPWASDAGYAGKAADRSFSFMKNRWVRLRLGDRVCYAQIEDAGPGQYQDKQYVFGADDARPLNKDFNGAGMDVSPAVNGYLGFQELDGESDKVDWQFVEQKDVPPGPWLKIVTVSQVQ